MNVVEFYDVAHVDKFYMGVNPIFVDVEEFRLEFAKTGRQEYSVQCLRIGKKFGEPFTAGEFGNAHSQKLPMLRKLVETIQSRGWQVALPDGTPLTLETARAFCKEVSPFKKRVR